ncbi:MAG TPA: SUF system NifU family Fe-S cluster assembly protein [Elusimicrobiota bacterium]|jgi:nitrogen fixation NifU-like protein|nr:SUF system NifU family Fe-S cluster assembly protein [Elusimicrobiota bacterium]
MAQGDAELEELYQEVLLDYYRSGSHKGRLPKPDFSSHGINPVCGDEIELTMTRDAAGNIAKIRFDGHGCVISQASSAMMAEALEGRSAARARELAAAFKDAMLSKAPIEGLPEELEAVKSMEGVRRFPLRVKCATLAWNTLLQGLAAPEARAAEYQETE